MAYTLITSLGTGMYKEEQKVQNIDGYRPTTYSFENGKKKTTKLFIEAIFECGDYDISKVVLIGTKTSSWGALIDKEIDKDLWEELKKEKCFVEEKSELATRIKTHIEKRWNVPFVLKIHTDEIDNNSSEDIFKIYSQLAPDIVQQNDILFDITHGFRSMPILLYQALQYSLTYEFTKKNVEIIYGEYNPETRVSKVRNLSNYWRFSQVTDALKVFQKKLDGSRLSELITDELPLISKIISEISDIVQTNYSLHIVEVIKRLKAYFEKVDSNQNGKSWYSDIMAELKKFVLLLDEESNAKTIYNYALLLKEKDLNTQSVIALEIAVEAAFAEKFGTKTDIGNYEWWQKIGKYIRNNFYDERETEWKPLYELNKSRNKIAHGGSRMDGEDFPNVKSVSTNFEMYKNIVEHLFDNLSNMSVSKIKEILNQIEEKKINENKEKTEFQKIFNKKVDVIVKKGKRSNSGNLPVIFEIDNKEYKGFINKKFLSDAMSLEDLRNHSFCVADGNSGDKIYFLKMIDENVVGRINQKNESIMPQVEKVKPVINFDSFILDEYKELKGKKVEKVTGIVSLDPTDYKPNRIVINFKLGDNNFSGIIPLNQFMMCGIEDRDFKNLNKVESKLNDHKFVVSKIKNKGIYLDYLGN